MNFKDRIMLLLKGSKDSNTVTTETKPKKFREKKIVYCTDYKSVAFVESVESIFYFKHANCMNIKNATPLQEWH